MLLKPGSREGGQTLPAGRGNTDQLGDGQRKFPWSTGSTSTADMLESYICSWPPRAVARLGELARARRCSWQTLHPGRKQVRPFRTLGPRPMESRKTLSSAMPRRAGGGLYGMPGSPCLRPETAPLYRLRLGRPPARGSEGKRHLLAGLRAGLVAVNPDRNKAGFITVKPPIPTTRFCDVFDVENRPLGSLTLRRPRSSPCPRTLAGIPVRMVGNYGSCAGKTGRQLTVATSRGSGGLFPRGRVQLLTHCGRWTTSMNSPNLALFSITFDKPADTWWKWSDVCRPI